MALMTMLLTSATVAISELGDKSHAVTLLLSAKYKDHNKVFFGIMAAFVLSIMLAITFGPYMVEFVSSTIGVAAIGFIFMLFGVYTFLSHEDGPIKIGKHSPFVSAFFMVFIAELGDKSQFVSGYLATRHEIVLLAVSLLLGLAVVTYATIFIGRKFNKHIHSKTLHYVSGSLFVLIGILTLFNLY